MAKSHKTCMEQAEIIDTFGTYQRHGATPNSEVRWAAQAILTLGGTIRHQPCIQEQLVLFDRLHQGHQAQGHIGSGNGASVERRAFMSVL